jgi:hypothetical protein
MLMSNGKGHGVRLGRPGSDLLSQVLRLSTIGAGGLNDRVRYGIGWGTPARTTRSAKPNANNNTIVLAVYYNTVPATDWKSCIATCSSPRMGLRELIKPIEQLVPVSFTHRCASTPGLST